MEFLKNLDARWADKALWQFVKFNLVSLSITVVQLLLANLLPLVFDGVTGGLPPFLQPLFDPQFLFEGPSRYVVDGVVTWGFVLPFFRGSGTKTGLAAYLVVLTGLILFSTWLQGIITAKLSVTSLAALARTIAAMAAGLVQMAVLFPLEKFVLFRKRGK